MGLLADLVGFFYRPVTGIEVDEPDPLVVGVRPAPALLFRAAESLFGSDAFLYWEGPLDRTVAAWLRRLSVAPSPGIRFGIAPLRDFYHVPLTDGVLGELATRLERAGQPRGSVRLHIHEGGPILLEWKRAFRDGRLLLSRSLPSERVAAFVAAVGGPPGGADG